MRHLNALPYTMSCFACPSALRVAASRVPWRSVSTPYSTSAGGCAGASVAVLVENAPGGESGSAGGRSDAGGAPWVQPLGRWELLADPTALEELAASAQARIPVSFDWYAISEKGGTRCCWHPQRVGGACTARRHAAFANPSVFQAGSAFQPRRAGSEHAFLDLQVHVAASECGVMSARLEVDLPGAPVSLMTPLLR